MPHYGISQLAATQSVIWQLSKAEAVPSADSRSANQNLQHVIRTFATMMNTPLSTFFSAMKTLPARLSQRLQQVTGLDL